MKSLGSLSRVVALLVAGGSGQRMGASIAKQFIEIQGKPILMHCMQKLADTGAFDDIVLVLPRKDMEYWSRLCLQYNFKVQHRLAEGGETRFHSVQNGLLSIQDSNNETMVAIHDGVRPFINAPFIQKGIDECKKYGNAVPCLKINESLRILEDNSPSRILDREMVRSVQTPQFFNFNDILNAYARAIHDKFTDDASVYENTGKSIHLFEGLPQNIKITQTLDLVYADFLLKEGF